MVLSLIKKWVGSIFKVMKCPNCNRILDFYWVYWKCNACKRIEIEYWMIAGLIGWAVLLVTLFGNLNI